MSGIRCVRPLLLRAQKGYSDLPMQTSTKKTASLAKAPPGAPLAERLLAKAMERGADFAEVYGESAELTAVTLDEDKVKSVQSGRSLGVGIRVIVGSKVGYAYSDDLEEDSLFRAAETAALVASSGGSTQPQRVSALPLPSYYRVSPPLVSVEVQEKRDLVLRANKAARRADKRVKQVMAAYADVTKRIFVANTRGLLAEDTQDLCRLSTMVVAEGKGGERRTGFYGGGGRVSFQHFDTFTPELVAQEAVRQSIATMGAREAEAGAQTVVLAPGWSGILLHEAVGHGLEADFIRKGTSLFAGKLGEKVASDLVTVIDDGTIANSRGSINVDDEGGRPRFKVLIERGVLKGFMVDDFNANLMGLESTGSGRRESFKHLPMPRMTNTYLAPGEDDPADILRDVDRGIYCATFGGGQVDITNGNFVFEVTEAYEIRKGKKGRPLKGVTLIGVGPQALKNVTRVGNDAQVDPGLGTCGKDGQTVPVGVGLPTVRIDGMTVGGTKVAR